MNKSRQQEKVEEEVGQLEVYLLPKPQKLKAKSSNLKTSSIIIRDRAQSYAILM